MANCELKPDHEKLSMKFYDCQTAPSPRRVRMFIAEKGLEIPTQEIDLRSGEQLGKDFLKVNPNATVPVLETDDGTRFTSTACRAYLESEYPEPALLGRNSIERGHVAGLVWKIESDGLWRSPRRSEIEPRG